MKYLNQQEFQMKNFAMAIALLASVNTFAQVVYTDAADLSTSTINHTIVDAEYKLIPTQTTTRKVPGGVVLASEPVVALNVAFTDTMFASEGNEVSYVTFTFKTTDFDAADVASLKAASPAWRHPFNRAGKNFAKKYFTLQVKKAARTIS